MLKNRNMTEWRKIEDYPNYEISDQGEVWNLRRGILQQTFYTSGGTEMVRLSCNGKSKAFAIDYLVASSFCKGKQPGYSVRHIDGNKYNYHPSNLEWYKKVRKPTFSEKCKNESICCNETGIVYENIYKCHQNTGIKLLTLRKCLKYPYLKNHDGYSFKFVN